MSFSFLAALERRETSNGTSAGERRAGRAVRRRMTKSRPAPWLSAFAVFVCSVFLPLVRAAEVIPPAPQNHFNDYARLVRPETAARLNAELAQFERDTSNQIVVAIYPRLQSESSVEDYTVRVAQAWRVGQRERRNGAVLFVFQASRDIRIVTGYGLEGALPDALCKQIVENEIVPRFRAGDFDGGLAAGVRAMLAATRGEYRGTGATVAAGRAGQPGGRGFGAGNGVAFFIMLFVFASLMRGASRRRGTLYGRRGRRGIWLGGGPWIGGSGGWGGGSWGGGGGGGGTFSGGGGSFGGGGAGGKW